ncbi:hypothetical protein LCGC14_2366110 [marine sediment metagenome]|uniref:Uncharacterized protein n=1 Tax=marine sediment metagenome TaxID=412755 RepID=A0A0F9C534_9ZZZZ
MLEGNMSGAMSTATAPATQDLAQRMDSMNDRIANAVIQIHAIADHLLGAAGVNPVPGKDNPEVVGWYQEMQGRCDRQDFNMADLERGIERLRAFV